MAVQSPALPAVAPCPRCGKPLTDAAGLGWCAACGYCRSLEETAGQVKVENAEIKAAPPAPVAAAVPTSPAAERLAWLFPLLLGIGVIGWISFSAGRRLPPDSFPRALWTSVEIAAGVLVLLVGQFIALIRLAPSDEKLSFKDVLMPFRLYGHIFPRARSMPLPVWTLGWGLSAIASALLFVGGLNHWFTYLKKDKNPNPPVVTPRK